MRTESLPGQITELATAPHPPSIPAFTKLAVLVFLVLSAFGTQAHAYDPEARLIQSCLSGLGRVDINIVNKTNDSALYRLEFQGQTARAITVASKDWGRLRFTGRPPGDYQAVVKRNGIVILSENLTVTCNNTQSTVTSPEVTVMNACRNTNGYVLFQMVNPTVTTRPYIIEFDGVPNRSTSAALFGQAIRATTGRPDGSYNYLVRSGSNVISSGQIEVNCDLPANTGGLLWPIACIPGETCNAQIGFPDIDEDNLAYDCSAPGYLAHQGTDVSAPRGTDILAAEDGEVLWVFDNAYDNCPSNHPDCQPPSVTPAYPGQADGYLRCTTLGFFCGDGNPDNGQCFYCFAGGNTVVIRHSADSNVFATRYDHMKAGSITVSEGQTVQKGQKIAEVASAGASTGNHLHFEVWANGFYDLADPWAGPCGPNTGTALWDTGTNYPWQ